MLDRNCEIHCCECVFMVHMVMYHCRRSRNFPQWSALMQDARKNKSSKSIPLSVCEMEQLNSSPDGDLGRVNLWFHISDSWHKQVKSSIYRTHTNTRLGRTALFSLASQVTADLSLISVLKELMRFWCVACWLAAYSCSDLSVQS